MTILSHYPHLHQVGSVLPRMISEALALLGTKEFAGAADNPKIIGWAKEVGKDVAAAYGKDSIPWCGLFIALVAKRAAKPVIAGPLWARNWAKWGDKSPAASLGDVLVFQRPGGGGHVGLYIAEDAANYHVLGGNQSDAVTITSIAKSRCIAVRRPAYRQMPASVRPYKVGATGAVSTNEA